MSWLQRHNIAEAEASKAKFLDGWVWMAYWAALAHWGWLGFSGRHVMMFKQYQPLRVAKLKQH